MASDRRLQLVPTAVSLVDTCVILDILTADSTWGSWSASAVADARDRGELVINPIIYAEVSVGFERTEDLDDAVPSTDFRREPLPYEAGFLAAKALLAYRRRGGAKTAPLPDFYIGAHAAIAEYQVITRDKARFSTYFPTVELLTPT
ncbi:PilT domain-containing protein [Kribbella flavida DSM 17836]|uniref:PilT domain-containing protein n=1 Tax=Kribbella flavida (strain DSM 17836 / JCM 10339 / NBRC 14399) TaxID=479435 RepID=D2PVW3_KRIFD|nr:type II toxin-antitoxin system VapC family toxin [Kribbella flavida]ADB29620.1 PilT domain-containing protein [Kribbella flavida DSM 17836]